MKLKRRFQFLLFSLTLCKENPNGKLIKWCIFCLLFLTRLSTIFTVHMYISILLCGRISWGNILQWHSPIWTVLWSYIAYILLWSVYSIFRVSFYKWTYLMYTVILLLFIFNILKFDSYIMWNVNFYFLIILFHYIQIHTIGMQGLKLLYL